MLPFSYTSKENRMTLLDKLFDKFGYVKRAQVDLNNPVDEPIEPNSYPERNLIPKDNREEQYRVEPIPPEKSLEMATPPVLNNHPEMLSGNPNITPKVDLNPRGDEPHPVQTPYTDEKRTDPQVGPSHLQGPNEKSIRPVMDVEDVNTLNPNVAMRMRKAGILIVDKEIFMERYNHVVKTAMIKKIPLSEVFK